MHDEGRKHIAIKSLTTTEGGPAALQEPAASHPVIGSQLARVLRCQGCCRHQCSAGGGRQHGVAV